MTLHAVRFLAVICCLICEIHCFLQYTSPPQHTERYSAIEDSLQPTVIHRSYSNEENDSEQYSIPCPSSDRAWLTTALSRRSVLIAGITPGVVMTTLPSLALSDSTTSSNAIMNDLLGQLRTIPTFCIVSNSTGAAYMLYKRDLNMGIGYAFLTFTGALAVLKDAQENALQKGYGDVWTNATITTIPLDVAIRLALKKRPRVSSKDQSLDTLLMLIPGAEERLDGMAIDQSRFQEQGRVPLFYAENTSPPDEIVFYFQRKDLISDWAKRHPQSQSPVVKAIDLVGIFESLLLGRNVEGKVSTLPLSAKFVFVPNAGDVAIAKEMKSRGLAPYNPNAMVL